MNFIHLKTLTFLYKGNCTCLQLCESLDFSFFIKENSFGNSVLEMRCQPNAQKCTNWHFVSFKYSVFLDVSVLSSVWLLRIGCKKKKSWHKKKKDFITHSLESYCGASDQSNQWASKFSFTISIFMIIFLFLFFFFSIFSCGWIIEGFR